MIKISLIDDSKLDRKVMKHLLDMYSAERGIEMRVSEYVSSEEYLNSQTMDDDVIFLDIYMDVMNGVDLARELRERASRASIIFVSGSNEFASEAFEVEADSYLKKPVDKESFFRTLDKVYRKLGANLSIEMFIGRLSVRIYVDSILYIEKAARKLIIHTEDDEYETYHSIKKIMEMLPEDMFVRISRFEAVSLRHIRKMEGTTIYLDRNGIIREASKKYTEEINNAIIAFQRD